MNGTKWNKYAQIKIEGRVTVYIQSPLSYGILELEIRRLMGQNWISRP